MRELKAHITGTVWRIEVKVGDRVNAGDTIAILESMKMEMPLESEWSGVVHELRTREGAAISEGDVVAVIA